MNTYTYFISVLTPNMYFWKVRSKIKMYYWKSLHKKGKHFSVYSYACYILYSLHNIIINLSTHVIQKWHAFHCPSFWILGSNGLQNVFDSMQNFLRIPDLTMSCTGTVKSMYNNVYCNFDEKNTVDILKICIHLTDLVYFLLNVWFSYFTTIVIITYIWQLIIQIIR